GHRSAAGKRGRRDLRTPKLMPSRRTAAGRWPARRGGARLPVAQLRLRCPLGRACGRSGGSGAEPDPRRGRRRARPGGGERGMSRRVIVGCVGNVLRGDDGFGPAVAERLTDLPRGAEVIETGIGGVALLQELMTGCEGLVVIDAVDRGAEPGTV